METSSLSTRSENNAKVLTKDLLWLQQVIEFRLQNHRQKENQEAGLPAPPGLDPEESMYGHFMHHYNLSAAERLVVLLVLAPYIKPEILDIFFQPNEVLGRGYTELGGVQGKSHGGFLPTGETALFLLAGERLDLRFTYQNLFNREHIFVQHNILKLEPVEKGEPLISGLLVLADEIIDFLTTGDLRKPDFSRDFPARLLTTEMEWDDLVLSPETVEQLKELDAWIGYEQVLMDDWGLKKRLRPGYKCLFYGPSGTGKTVTATVLGKRFEKDVYRIDLSSVVSKYIGETEKNLERIFDRAEKMNCILFFDEADSLFSKRTQISSSHDRYANQEVSYLLQRVEDFTGIVILASNFKGNFDEAFSRRFQAVVHFPMPNDDERLRLWKEALPDDIRLEKELSLVTISREYKLSGGAILNVIRYALLMALHNKSKIVLRKDILNGVRRELQKEGKTL